MKLNNVFRFLAAALAFLFVPFIFAAAQSDQCPWIKKAQMGELSWATWNPDGKAITLDVLAVPYGEAVQFILEIQAQQFTHSYDGDGNAIWTAPSNWS